MFYIKKVFFMKHIFLLTLNKQINKYQNKTGFLDQNRVT
jgi:hypothetical protein